MTEARLHVRAIGGRYARRRRACTWLTQLVFFGLPWLEWNGEPLLLVDLAARRLTLLGSWWWPHDLAYLAALLPLAAGALLFSSAWCSRVFCGYGCPHTVYGGIFMAIERACEGTPAARLRRARTPSGLARRVATHGAWLLAAAAIGLTLAAYFTPARVLLRELAAGALGPWQLLCAGGYGALAWLNAGLLRERFCRFICPWGRFQSLAAGPAALEVRYDAARGEPRARRNRKSLAEARPMGDCIDCTLCVQVCPTGSDIRLGQPFDCIACGACADACDQVMDRIGAARGLVGYARAAPGARFWRQRRVAAGAAVFGLALAAFAGALWQRAPFKLSVQRERGVALRMPGDGTAENLYRLHVINTDRRPHSYRISVSGLAAPAEAWPRVLRLAPGAQRVLALRIRAAVAGMAPGPHRIAVELSELERPALALRQPAVFYFAPAH